MFGSFDIIEVRFGSRLCENSDVQLARRKFVSIMLNKKGTALAGTIERRKERKRFCGVSVLARFHTAWTLNGSGVCVAALVWATDLRHAFVRMN